MRSMWLVVDDPDGFDQVPYGWDVIDPEPFEVIDAGYEVTGEEEAPDGYVGAHRLA